MSYVQQIEAYVAAYPETASVHVPQEIGTMTLPAFPHVVVHTWDADFCELQDANWQAIARFRLVG